MESSKMEATVDRLEILFEKAQTDLEVAGHLLEMEFDERTAKNAATVNPLKLMRKIAQLQEELLQVKEDCQQLLAAKQDLIDTARRNLLANRLQLRNMQTLAGLQPVPDSEDAVYNTFSGVIHDWEKDLGFHDHTQTTTDLNLNLEIIRSVQR
eukprot:TRINITY_DN2866_c0_g3_i1.p1 TRINITY_DN2866_c0_g3~~TRINITY_DN2866_c0_g3_i1.p1  ORF type:complete len:153 (-),score=43.03 TRINITY_DN2866_c0_g3_i1:323-781(-)